MCAISGHGVSRSKPGKCPAASWRWTGSGFGARSIRTRCLPDCRLSRQVQEVSEYIEDASNERSLKDKHYDNWTHCPFSGCPAIALECGRLGRAAEQTGAGQNQFPSAFGPGEARQTGSLRGKFYLPGMRRTATFIAVLIIVAGLSYGLGRKHGAGTRERPHHPAIGQSANLATPPSPGAAAPEDASPQEATAIKPALAALDRTAPFVQNMISAQAGYEAAKLNLDNALKQIETLPTSERKGFITGVFSFVARHRSPAEALALYGQQGEKVRSDALRALASEWVSTRSPLDEEKRYAVRERVQAAGGGRLGLEVELAFAIASSAPDDELVTAWLNAFSTHPGRSEMLPVLANKLIRENPDALLDRVEGWTEWERERALRAVLEDWASRSPQEAWTWYQAQRARLGQDLAPSILEPWARSDPEAAKALLNSLSDPAQRRTAVESLGRALALQNTAQAVAWAEGLLNPEENEAAHRSIYQATPRGIGAAIGLENGFPTLRAILPGSPLEGTGVRAGDQFVEVWQADGSRQSLYGAPLESAVGLIRGEPGSDLVLRILRRDERSGQLQELHVPVRRDQLYFDGPLSPKKN